MANGVATPCCWGSICGVVTELRYELSYVWNDCGLHIQYSTTQPAILSELLCILGAEGCVVTLFLTFPNHCLYWRNWFVWQLVAIYIEAKSLIDSSVSLSVAIGGIIMHAYSTFLSSWRSRRECSVRCKLTNSWQTVSWSSCFNSYHASTVYLSLIHIWRCRRRG